MQFKLNSEDDLPLNKTTEIPFRIIVVKAVFNENRQYYSQFFLD